MSWNPMMGPASAMGQPMQGLGQALQQYQPNQLGAGVTLGNPQAQQNYAQELAQALADADFSAKQIERAEGMMTPEYIQNSGWAGVADMILKTYAGKKMDEKARKLQADAEARRMTAQEGYEDRKATKDAERAERLSVSERTRREADARRYGMSNREAAEYILTGKMSQPVRGVPMMTNQGLVNVNPYTNEYESVQPQGQRDPANVRIDPSMSPEDQAIARADAATRGDPHGETVDYGRIQRPGQGPLMPYKDPEIAARQAAADARANAQLGLAARAADRADAAETRAQEAARVAQEKAQREAGARNGVMDQWQAAREGLESGLSASETGPLAGRIPAFTTEQQVAEGAVAATAPILKQIFRTAGEGTFTDKD